MKMLDPIVQVALDLISIDDALRIGKQAKKGGVDWIEAGTPLIKSEGISSIERLNQEFPENKIVGDMKIMDAGELEVILAGNAGADVITVLGTSDDKTIEEAVKAAEDLDVEIAVDLIAVENPTARTQELENLGVDYVIAHTGIDQQKEGKDPFRQFKSILSSTEIPIIIAGGLNAKTAEKAAKMGASIIIVGSEITKAKDPLLAATKIVESVRNKND